MMNRSRKVIIPTYMNKSGGKRSFMVRLLEKSGAGFKQQFELESYKAFFKAGGYENIRFDVVEGKMPAYGDKK